MNNENKAQLLGLCPEHTTLLVGGFVEIGDCWKIVCDDCDETDRGN